jgi:hypothetical protein
LGEVKSAALPADTPHIPLQDSNILSLSRRRDFVKPPLLTDHGARQEDAALGRFLQVDPEAEGFPSMRGYLYLGGDPFNHSDPDGRRLVRGSPYAAGGRLEPHEIAALYDENIAHFNRLAGYAHKNYLDERLISAGSRGVPYVYI